AGAGAEGDAKHDAEYEGDDDVDDDAEHDADADVDAEEDVDDAAEGHPNVATEGEADDDADGSRNRQWNQALARVPQLWTSYSGNLREVKVMCMAVRSSLERDELRTLHGNITRAQLVQSRLIEEQHRMLDEARVRDSNHVKDILDMQATVKDGILQIKSTTGTLLDSLRGMIDYIQKVHSTAQEDLSRREHEIVSFVSLRDTLFQDFNQRLTTNIEALCTITDAVKQSIDASAERTQQLNSYGIQLQQTLGQLEENIIEANQKTQSLSSNTMAGFMELESIIQSHSSSMVQTTRSALESVARELSAFATTQSKTMDSQTKMANVRFRCLFYQD
ncbi:hypothetical protein DFQ26_000793, partial [Actinomortierella ambigua]